MVAARSVQRDTEKFHGILFIDPIGDICLLRDSQVNVHLGHPMQRQLKAAIAAVLDNVGPETYNLLFLVCPPPLHNTPCLETPTLRHIPYQQQYPAFFV